MRFKFESLHYGWIILTVGTLVVFGALGLGRLGYGMVLPAMQEGLGMDNTQAGALASANLTGYLCLSALGGALASRFGPRVVITVGMTLAGASMVLTGLSHGIIDTGIWRTITGVGSGASNVPIMGLLAAWFSLRRRGVASGIAVAGSSIALILLGYAAPPVLAAYGDSGWRVCWFAYGGITLFVAALAGLLLRNCPSEYNLCPVGDANGTPPVPVKSEGLRWSLIYRSRAVWQMGFVYTAYGFAYITYLTFFVKGLIADGGYTQAQAGQLFMTMGWVSLSCGLIWGHVSDVIGRKGALVIVYLIQAVAYSLYAFMPTSVGFTLSALLFGVTAFSVPAIIAAACGDMLGPRLAPAALGFVTLFLGIGQAVGPTVGGMIGDAAGSLPPAMIPPAVASALGAIGAALMPATVNRDTSAGPADNAENGKDGVA